MHRSSRSRVTRGDWLNKRAPSVTCEYSRTESCRDVADEEADLWRARTASNVEGSCCGAGACGANCSTAPANQTPGGAAYN